MSMTTMLPSFVRSALTLAPATLALALAACTPSAGQGREREADAGGASARAPNEGSTAPAYAGPKVDVIAGLPWPEAPAMSDQAQHKAPFSLTASDGAGLRLVALTARGVVEGPLAFTELRLVFDNPEDRTIEGRFEIEMPPGAAISRFAMKVDERWQEGEVVERQAARAVYEDFLHRRQDPALLEKSAGNSFSARVFPIPARGRKELIVAYSQGLADPREPYRVMLRGLPEIELLDA
ncbi:MAG TPA: VIT domain-containing protein, partial [Nannocystaceae bacterium]|nr:VIT domain-containing protein [Nannocystaceae bacterium]